MIRLGSDKNNSNNITFNFNDNNNQYSQASTVNKITNLISLKHWSTHLLWQPGRYHSSLKKVSDFWISQDNALRCLFCRKFSIGKFKLQVSFSLGSSFSDKNIWNAVSISSIYCGASWLQAHKPAKGLAPFTYTVKLWKSWGHWPS